MGDVVELRPPALDVAVKNLQVHRGLSDETLAFTASVWLDGKRVGEVRNAGHGGPHEYSFDDRDVERRLNEYARQRGHTFEPLDGLIDELVEEIELQRDAARLVRRGATLVLLIQKHPYEYPTRDGGEPLRGFSETYLLGSNGGDPAKLAQDEGAVQWRQIHPKGDTPVATTTPEQKAPAKRGGRLTDEQVLAEAKRLLDSPEARSRGFSGAESSIIERAKKIKGKRAEGGAKKKRRSSTPSSQFDDETRALAKQAGELADAKGVELKTKPGPAQVVKVRDHLKKTEQTPIAASGLSAAKLAAYAQGKPERSIPDRAELAMLRATSKAIGDHLIWGRKLAAILLALHEQS